MRNWLLEPEDLADTPSRRSGIDADTEQRYRIEGVKLILDVGQILKLEPYPTLATAAVYFHRFFVFHSFREFNRYITSLSCLFLAGKVEETPKKCRDILQAARERFTEEQWMRLAKYHMVGTWVDEVMAIERVLLQTVKFDLQVNHPYEFVLKYAKVFNRKNDAKHNAQIQQVVQAAWTFVNDSLCTVLCLLWEPEVIAIALLYLASRFSKVEFTDWKGKRNRPGEKWYDQFVENMDKQTLEDICHKVLDFYSATNQQASGTGAGPGSVTAAPTNASKVSPNSGSGSTPQTPRTPVPAPPPQPPPSTTAYARRGSTSASVASTSSSGYAGTNTRNTHNTRQSTGRPQQAHHQHTQQQQPHHLQQPPPPPATTAPPHQSHHPPPHQHSYHPPSHGVPPPPGPPATHHHPTTAYPAPPPPAGHNPPPPTVYGSQSAMGYPATAASGPAVKYPAYQPNTRW